MCDTNSNRYTNQNILNSPVEKETKNKINFIHENTKAHSL